MKKVSDVLISDLASRADPRGVSARNPNCWRPVPYTTHRFSGVMLGCGTGPRPVPVTIRLNVKGRYRIWAALYSFMQSATLRLRLSGDITAREISPPKAYRWKIGLDGICLYEVFFRDADLTGQHLVLEPLCREQDESYLGALAYLRLEPVAPAPRVRRRIVRHPMILTNDGHGIFEIRPHLRPQDLLETFEAVPANSCTSALFWGIGDGDICNYPTRVGNYFPTSDRFASRTMRTFMANLALWRKNGWNSLTVMRDYAASRKWEFQAYIRVGAFVCPYPLHFLLRSRFFQGHPAWWCRDREGRAVTRLSYAFPSVQAHMAALVAELAGYRLDGVCLAFVRGVPLLLYEKPVVEGFKQRYGLDPRRVSEEDPRWWAYQASVVTAFVEKAKAAIRPTQRLSVMVPGNERDCRRWGLDVADWVQRGLVDDVCVTGQRFDETDVHRDDPKSLDFDYFRRLKGRARVRLMPMLYPWETFSNDYPAWRAILRSCLDPGADAYVVWDGSTFAGQDAFRKFEVGFKGPAPARPKSPSGRREPLISVDGFRVDRYHHFETV